MLSIVPRSRTQKKLALGFGSAQVSTLAMTMEAFDTMKRKGKDVMETDEPLEGTSSGTKSSRAFGQTRRQALRSVYTLCEELGRGRDGVITRLCKHKVTGEELACKSIAKRSLTREETEAVDQEVEIMKCLAAADNIVKLEEVYEDENYIHLVMEFCAGGELFTALNETKNGYYGEREAASLCRKIVEGVQTCHDAGVLHGDLKMENILFLTKETKGDSPIRLIDFGASRFFKDGEVFTNSEGTPIYMAPEMHRRCYSKDADLWSVGVILYVLLSGGYPFEGRTEADLQDAALYDQIDFTRCPWPQISNKAKDLVKRLLERNPEKRLTAREVLSHPWILMLS